MPTPKYVSGVVRVALDGTTRVEAPAFHVAPPPSTYAAHRYKSSFSGNEYFVRLPLNITNQDYAMQAINQLVEWINEQEARGAPETTYESKIDNVPKVFISYSWDNDRHKQWVKELATRLRADGIETILDQWVNQHGDDLPRFMEQSIANSKFTLIICTPNYKDKSELGTGGVGYEKGMITAELFVKRNMRKFIPVLREGEQETAIPVWLLGRYYADLRGNSYEEQYQDLLDTLLNRRETPPPVNKSAVPIPRNKPAHSEDSYDWEDIRMVRIVSEDVGEPKDDGSQGSALYEIPFELNKMPPLIWRQMFEVNWDGHIEWNSMYRPVNIVGDRIIMVSKLEEIEKYHFGRLKTIITHTNEQYRNTLEQQQRKEKKEKERRHNREKDSDNLNERLEFD